MNTIKNNGVKEKVIENKLRHKKKLFFLWNKQRMSKTPNCIINLSDYTLTLNERNALLFGFKHSIPPKHLDEITTKASIETQIQKIAKMEKKTLDYDTIEEIRITTSKFIAESNKACSTRKNQAIHRTLRRISNNNNIKCLRMDKGNGIVILKTTDYINKMNKIL